MKQTRWLLGEKKEPYMVITSLAIAFLVLIVMVFVLSSALIEREDLKMQSEAERSFNSIYLAIQDEDNVKAVKTMQDEKVTGVGIYNSKGRRVMSLGAVPQILDISKFSSRNDPQSINTGITNYNPDTGLIEYIRFSRLNILLNTGNLTLSSDGLLSVPIDFPDVLYVVFDGTAYHKRTILLRLLSAVASILLCCLFLTVMNIYRNNRTYRKMLAKQESLVNLGQAARTLTHEIKNPLSAITIQLALLKKLLPKENHADLAVLETEVQRLTQLTNKVSDFLRNPLGTPTVVDLTDLFTRLIATFDKDVKFQAHSDEKILIDQDRARSIFENLLKNAMESCTGRDPQVEVRLNNDKRGHVIIQVLDRGDGVPKENENKVFDPFFTTKIHGSGIGLSISRQFIKARGGDIRLYDREGGGTVAEVIMPSDLQLPN